VSAAALSVLLLSQERLALRWVLLLLLLLLVLLLLLLLLWCQRAESHQPGHRSRA
jgi:hypothetical protein